MIKSEQELDLRIASFLQRKAEEFPEVFTEKEAKTYKRHAHWMKFRSVYGF